MLAGAGGNDTAHVIETALEFKRLGANGILSVAPVLQQTHARRVVPALQGDCSSGGLPIIVYNIPGRTGVNVEPATMVRLAQIENIVGVKEASGNISQMAVMLVTCRRASRCFPVMMESLCR